MSEKPKLRPLRVLLLKPHNGLPLSALRKKVRLRLRRHGLRKQLPFRGALFVRPPRAEDASWVDFVAPNVLDDLVVKTSTSAAVLIVEAAGRHFAFVFGYGRSLIERAAYVRDFGLKVTLNAVNPESLRSIDAKTFESLTLLTRRQASRGSPLDVFGLNVTQDLLQAVAGTPREEDLAHRVAGSDALAFSARVEFPDLGDKCAALLDMYGRDIYKKHFAFVDRLRRVSDPAVIQGLEDSLDQLLRAGTTDRMHLALPEIDDPIRIESFGYSTAPETRRSDLDLGEFLSTLPRGPGSASMDALRRADVLVHYAEGGTSEHLRVLDCLTAEVERPDRLYVLSAGEWFEVDKLFASKIATRVTELAGRPISLPPARSTEIEEKYNKRVAKKLGCLLLDGTGARVRDTATPIEFCDLLTADRQIIHVKRKTRSATLSHLFAQGYVSAEAFLHDAVFRQDAKDLVKARDPKMVTLIPDAPPRPSDYTVVYAIITSRTTGWPKTLPFFSQVNLCNAADRLERLSYRVSLTVVPVA